ncbi:hypothetical protein RCL_jg14151.t1 [Rhizophagus clarus]|uniref:Uncharacterized protein n=1 Tax=Rhizophagus clarus TaxID=94130 RepID=A0A8H3QW35_9GLOM|nr:hypothetical protein RCL_jg14151.t1 [Rhizophagus clarus]
MLCKKEFEVYDETNIFESDNVDYVTEDKENDDLFSQVLNIEKEELNIMKISSESILMNVQKHLNTG